MFHKIVSVVWEGQLDNPVRLSTGLTLIPTTIYIFLEKTMQQKLHRTKYAISVGCIEINNLRFADDIGLIAGSNEDLQTLTN